MQTISNQKISEKCSSKTNPTHINLFPWKLPAKATSPVTSPVGQHSNFNPN